MSKANSKYAPKLQEIVLSLDGQRKDRDKPVDITLAEYLLADGGTSVEAFYDDLGINPNQDTIENLMTMPDTNYRWIIPELFRDAIRLGVRKAPIYPNLIAGEQSVSQMSITMPAINMSDATPKKLNVAETIPLGDVSWDQKSVKIHKFGRGIKIPYEVRQYVSLNMVGIYMQDMGIKMGMGLDYLAITTLLNGDQADGSDSVATIGIGTANTMTFRDLLKPWIRMNRLGKTPTTQVSGEDMAIDLIEFYSSAASRDAQGAPRATLNVKAQLPQSTDLWIHGAISANKLLMVDKSAAMMKLNAQPLLVESEKIVSNQTEATYATFTTGFATIFRDARLVLDKSVTFQSNPFPEWMNPYPHEIVPFTRNGAQ